MPSKPECFQDLQNAGVTFLNINAVQKWFPANLHDAPVNLINYILYAYNWNTGWQTTQS